MLASHNSPKSGKRNFTPRALLMGLAGGLFIDAYAYFNDYAMNQTLFVNNTISLTIYSGLFGVPLGWMFVRLMPLWQFHSGTIRGGGVAWR